MVFRGRGRAVGFSAMHVDKLRFALAVSGTPTNGPPALGVDVPVRGRAA